MIVFIAVPIEHGEDFDYLAACVGNLQQNTVSGRFVRLGNMHVTLVYLGETDRIDEIETIMDEEFSGIESFLFTLDRTGSFARGRSSTVWVGGTSERLSSLYDALFSRLTEAGFELESRSYRPHITLARNVVFSSERRKGSGKGKDRSEKSDARKRAFENPPHVLPVERIALFSSEQLEGKRVYRELHSIELDRR